MRIGRQAHAESAISGSNAQTIVIRGHDLCQQLLGEVSFTDHVWLLIAGQLPTDRQRWMLDATLVAIAEHGLVPSVQAGRMTIAAEPSSMQGAVAAGLLGCGSVILGAAQDAGTLLDGIVQASKGTSLEAAARDRIASLARERRAIAGFGHPLHSGGDPRAQKLLAIADNLCLRGSHIAAALMVEQVVPGIVGKALPLNVSGAIAAVLLDAGFPLGGLRGVPLLARVASLVAHALEELEQPIAFTMSHAAAKAIRYDGPAPDGFVADEG